MSMPFSIEPVVKRLSRAENPIETDEFKPGGSFERLIMHLATAFVNAPIDRLDEMINDALRLSGRGAGVDRSYLMRYDTETELVCNTHEWCEQGIEPMIDYLQEVPFEGLDDFLESHFNGEVLLVSRVEGLQPGSRLRELLEPQSIQTLVAVPLMDGTRCLGFVGFDAVRSHKEWSSKEIDLLWILAEVFINAERAVVRERALSEAKRQAEMAEKRLQRAVLAGDFAIWERDLLRNEIAFVCGWNRLLGHELDGHVEPVDRFFEMVVSADWTRLKECVIDCSERPGDQFEVEFQMHRKGGEVIDVRGRWVVDHQDGKAIRFVGSVENISILKQQQNEVRKRAEVEALANRISARFTGIEVFESARKEGFADFITFTGAQRLSFWLPKPGHVLEGGLSVQRQSSGNKKGKRKVLKSPVVTIHPACLESLKAGKSLWMGALMKEDCGLTDWVRGGGNQSAIAVPVRIEGRLNAVLLVESEEEEMIMNRQDQHLLHLITHILAGAMARNRVEQELRTNREFYWMILESLAEAVLLTTLEGRVLYANRAWASISGRSGKEAMRLKLADLVHYEDVQKEEAAHRQALEGTLSEAYSMRLVTDRMGTVRWFKVMKKVVNLPILAGDTGLLITLEDDTERHEWEETLITAKVQAETMSEAKTLYLSKASHELRTPLHGILSLLELLQRTPLNLEQLRWVESAEWSAKTLLGIFDDVLEVSKLERGVVKLNVKPTGLEAMMESLVAMFAKDAKGKGLELSLNLAEGLPRVVEIDELRTRQVLINLISNAVRYTAKGEIQVSVGATERSGDNHLWLEFTVKDTGPGIPLQDQERLFIPFVQLENHQRVLGEGSGLGLPIVRELCRLMKADLRVESDGATGTTMRFLLPGNAPQERIADDEQDVCPGAILQGRNVLVVEDNEISRYVASQHLKALGGLVTTASDGTEALEVLSRQPQYLVLTDCSMPRMNGFDLARWIRAQPAERGGKCWIIACTADTSIDNRHQCFDAGMHGVLTKPYARQQLQYIIEQVINQPQTVAKEALSWVLPARVADGAALRLELIGISMDTEPAFAQHFLRKTFSLFRQLVPEELAKIRQALRDEDANELRKRLHHLKSSAAAVGAEQLSMACSWFEDLAQSASLHAEKLPEEAAVMEALEQLIERCQLQMEQLLLQLPLERLPSLNG